MKTTPYWIPIVAATLCFAAILNMPYGFYSILRWVVSIASILIILSGFNGGSKSWAYLFILVLIIFNPFAKVSFNKSTWRLIDAGTGAALIGFTLNGNRKVSNEERKPNSNMAPRDAGPTENRP